MFTLNAKNHPGAKIWIGGDTFMVNGMVNGQRQPYVRNSRFEARRAAKLLSAVTGSPVVAVGVIVPVGAADIRVKKLPADVKVVNRMRLIACRPPARPAVMSFVETARDGVWSGVHPDVPRLSAALDRSTHAGHGPRNSVTIRDHRTPPGPRRRPGHGL